MSFLRRLLISPSIPSPPSISTVRSSFHSTAISSAANNRHLSIKKSTNTKFPKDRRGRVTGTASCRGESVSFGRYALRALEAGWITARAVNAGRAAMARFARPAGKLWVRVIADKSVTARPAETRMGRGKGAIKGLVSVVKPGRILYEIGGVSEKAAREAIAIAARKMPIRTQFVTSS